MDDEGWLHMELFTLRLQLENVSGAFELLTRHNVFFRHKDLGVLWSFCVFCKGDDVQLFRQILTLAGDEWRKLIDEGKCLLHSAIMHQKPRIARELVQLGVSIEMPNAMGVTPLQEAIEYLTPQKEEMANMLLDAGAKISLLPTRLQTSSKFLCSFVAQRDRAQSATIAFLGLRRCRSRVLGGSNGVDVLRMVARCVWALRRNKALWVVVTKKVARRRRLTAK